MHESPSYMQYTSYYAEETGVGGLLSSVALPTTGVAPQTTAHTAVTGMVSGVETMMLGWPSVQFIRQSLNRRPAKDNIRWTWTFWNFCRCLLAGRGWLDMDARNLESTDTSTSFSSVDWYRHARRGLRHALVTHDQQQVTSVCAKAWA